MEIVTNAELVRKITEEVLRRVGMKAEAPPAPTLQMHDLLSRDLVPVGISARHVHLTPPQVELLFGKGHQLTPMKPLSQPGQYAAEETVSVVGPRGRVIEKVRILGPARNDTQVELSQTDCVYLGIKAPVRASGDHRETPGILIVGPKGHLAIDRGVIRANRHLHLHTAEAFVLGLKDNQTIAVRLEGDKPTILFDVQVRVSDKFTADLHLDTDDGNAVGVATGAVARILRNM
jgi:putative phosphotransacetylase